MRSSRNTELALLMAAGLPIFGLFALSHAAMRGVVGWEDLALPSALLALFALAHLAVRRFAPGSDPVALPLSFSLVGIGLCFVERLQPTLAPMQLLSVALGVAALIGTLAFVPSIERLARYKYTTALAGVLALLLPALVGVEINGAKLWLRIGGWSFQPAEIAKVLLVVFLAAYLSENREVLSVSTRRVLGVWLPPARRLGPLLAMWVISLIILVAERDLGSSLLFFGVFIVMLHVATGRPGYVAVGLALFTLGAGAAYTLFSHVQTRISVWLDPFADASGRGYQLVQSLFALAAGGLIGVGPGRGLPTRIPFVATDFIFAAIGEELGLLGAAAVVSAYLIFCVRGLAWAARARSDTDALLLTGLVATFGLQGLVILGGVTRLIPLTGITLPFVSYGGSSMVANLMLLGLLLRAQDAATGRACPLATTSPGGALGRLAIARRLRQVAVMLSAVFVAIVANLTYVQVFEAPALAQHPANTRTVAQEARQERGAITTRDGVPLAVSRRQGRAFTRAYPAGGLAAHVTGYVSPRYGRAGIEQALNDVLVGHRAFTDLPDLVDALAGTPVAGNDVRLTIDSHIQAAAERALAGRRGACVVLDPRTGAVLALASSPAYDPSEVDETWTTLSNRVDAPLMNRATQSLYPPGSTFKVVTLTAAVGSGLVTPSTMFPGPARITIGGAPITNYGDEGYGTVTVRRATAASINTVFAQIADRLGPHRLVDTARGFGFGGPPPLEIPTRTSLMPDPDEMTRWETAWAGVGQPVGEHESPPGPQTTVLQMALVAAGIANDGVIMRPYLVDAVTSPDGTVLAVTEPRRWRRATDAATADTVTDMMVEVVRSGSGTRARLPGVTVAGKTGTAEAGEQVDTHAWFIAFAPAASPRVALAVMFEHAGVGGRVAAPAARSILAEALERQR